MCIRDSLKAASLTCGAHVLLECVEVADRGGPRYRREHLDGVELEHVAWIAADHISFCSEPRAVIAEEAQ